VHAPCALQTFGFVIAELHFVVADDGGSGLLARRAVRSRRRDVSPVERRVASWSALEATRRTDTANE
jgi:hypothetical protein